MVEVNPYGEVVDGELVLDAILQPAVWDPVVVGSEEGHLFDPAGVQTDSPESNDYKRGDQIGDVMPDAIEPVSEAIDDVHLALVKLLQQADDFVLHGLVLVPSQSGGTNAGCVYPVFRRVGWFSAPFCRSANTKAWLDSRRQRIMIV